MIAILELRNDRLGLCPACGRVLAGGCRSPTCVAAQRPARPVSERRVMLHHERAGRMPDRRPSRRFHGPRSPKCSDIERVRRDVDEAETRSVRAEKSPSYGTGGASLMIDSHGVEGLGRRLARSSRGRRGRTDLRPGTGARRSSASRGSGSSASCGAGPDATRCGPARARAGSPGRAARSPGTDRARTAPPRHARRSSVLHANGASP